MPRRCTTRFLLHNCVTDEEAVRGEWQGWLSRSLPRPGAPRASSPENCNACGRPPNVCPLLEAALARAGIAETEHRSGSAERHRSEAWTPEDAAREIVRGRLQASGPATAKQLGQVLGLDIGLVDAAVSALEGEGFVLRGTFTPESTDVEWCERGLLARIHRYTLNRLRKEIEAVTAADYLRFLLRWQHAAPDARMEGPEGLAVIIEQLEGMEAGAAAWEADVLPVRMEGYDPSWLDQLCISGRVTWSRRTPPTGRASSPIRTSPIAFSRREHVRTWRFRALSDEPVSSDAALALGMLRRSGACFFDDIVRETGLLATRTQEAVGELVSLGLVTADGFTGTARVARAGSKATAARTACGCGLQHGGRRTMDRLTGSPGRPRRRECRLGPPPPLGRRLPPHPRSRRRPATLVLSAPRVPTVGSTGLDPRWPLRRRLRR